MTDTPPVEDAQQKPPRWRRKLGLFAISLVFTLLLGEAAVRVYAHFSFPKMTVLDDALGWRHSASHAKLFTNEDGEQVLAVQNEFTNRGPAHPLERVPGKYRVLVLGDSFTEGAHVGEEQLFTAVLEAGTPNLEVINTGVGGWGTVQQYLYLREEGLRFQPDHVLLMFYENDLDDNVLPYSPGIGDRPYARIEAGEVRVVEVCDDDSYLDFLAPVPGRAFLFEHSYLFYAFNDRLWQPPRMAQLLEIERRDRAAIPPETKERVFVEMVRRIRALTSEEGIQLDVVLIPSRESLFAGRSERHERILAHCAEVGIRATSLLPTLLEAHGAGEKPYFKVDIHWNKHGHGIAGQALTQILEASRASK